MVNNISFNALCSNGTSIWAIDAKGVIYEIDEKKSNIRLVHWLEEIDDSDGLKFPIMCNLGKKILIAPAAGQKFWEYDCISGNSMSLTEASDEAFVNYYKRNNKIYFIGRECRNIAIYDCASSEMTIKNAGIATESTLSPAETRGGCDLDETEDKIFAFKYGCKTIYELGLDDEVSKECEINVEKPVAFAHKLDSEILIVTTDGRFYQKKENELLELAMPDGMIACDNAPFHYWTRIGGGLLFMPCAMNMVLYYKDGRVEKVCDTVAGVNEQGQMGIFPSCAYGNSFVVGFPRYDSAFLRISTINKMVERLTLKLDEEKNGTKQFIEASARKGRVINEGDFGISLDGFLDAIVTD